jgi:hypothetical protein
MNAHPVTVYNSGGRGPGGVIALGVLFVSASIVAILLGVVGARHTTAPVVLKVTASCATGTHGASTATGAATACARGARPGS